MRQSRRKTPNFRGALICLVLWLAPAVAFAQGAVLQQGTVFRGHLSQWLGNGYLMDAGGPLANGQSPIDPLNGILPLGLGIVNSGLGLCEFSAYASASAYSTFCFGFDGSGNALLSVSGVGQTPGLNISLNGTIYPFPGPGGGNLIGPTSPTITSGDVIVGNSGLTVADGGAPPSMTVATTSALKALSVASKPAKFIVGVSAYAAPGDMPPDKYQLSTATCSLNGGAGDAGSQIPSNTSGYCWLLMPPPSGVDPRNFGAIADLNIYNTTITANISTGEITLGSGTFTAADVGKNITLYGASTGSAGPTYWGTIASVSGAADIFVTPTPTNNPAGGSGRVAYGADSGNATAISNAIAYVCSMRGAAAVGFGFSTLNLNGQYYGVTAPVNATCAPVTSSTGTIIPLAAANNLSCTSTGILNISGSNSDSTVENLDIDANFLPVNGIWDTNQGYQIWDKVVIRHWMGSCASATMTGSGSSGAWEIDTANTTGITAGMVSRGNSSNGLPDRAVVVSVTPNTKIIVSKPLTSSPSNIQFTFYNDPSGVALGGNNTSAGPSMTNVSFSEFIKSDSQAALANLYGFDIAFIGTGADCNITASVMTYGIAQIFMGTNASGVHIVNGEFNSFVTGDTNPPALILADGAVSLDLTASRLSGGVVQEFVASSFSPTIRISNTRVSENGAATYSPSNSVQIWTNQSAVSNGRVVTDPSWDSNSSAYGYAAYFGPGSWAFTAGLDAGGTGLADVTRQFLPSGTSITAQQQCNAAMEQTSASTNITLPANANVGCDVVFSAGTSATNAYLAPASGATINNSSSNFGPLPMFQLTHCVVMHNADNASAQWACTFTPYSGATASIGGSPVSAGTCTSGTATITGATTGMAVAATPTNYPGDGFDWPTYVSGTNTVTVKVCNFTSGSLTPVASAYNVRVMQ